MTALAHLYGRIFAAVERLFGGAVLETLARLVFAGVLLVYFLNSALTKIGPGVLGFLSLTPGAYAQILPARMEAVGYDPSQLSALEHAVVYAGTYAEFVLPVLVFVGLFTRAAALGMIVFVAVMTFVDITGQGVGAATIGRWFDRDPSAAIADQRALWTFLLFVVVVRGPGPVSLDRLFGRHLSR